MHDNMESVAVIVTAHDLEYELGNDATGRLANLDGLMSELRPEKQNCEWIQITVINCEEETLESCDIAKTISLAARDDVWNEHFGGVIIIPSPIITAIHKKLSGRSIFSLSLGAELISDGPYILKVSTGEIFTVKRVVKDHNNAFIGACIRDDAEGGTRFCWTESKQISIPTRLGAQVTHKRPLAGLRFAVKDLIDVAGLQNGCGSKDYKAISPIVAESAPLIDRLIEAGATLLGKTKTTLFADGQQPSEWFEYIAPFNPRGDGFQMPSSSSTGSAVAIASYDWLDFTIGTDTGGSIRSPAGVNGVYGTRPSIKTIDSSGFGVTEHFDTVGVLTRNAAILQRVSQVISHPLTPIPLPAQKPSFRLLYPIRQGNNSSRWFRDPATNEPPTAADIKFESFVCKLENKLGVTRTPISIESMWRETRPENLDPDIGSATGPLYQDITYHDCVRNSVDPFIAEYKSKFEGKSPFIDSVLKARLDYGRQVSETSYKKAVEIKDLYSKWIMENVFTTSAPHDIPLLIFPQSWGQPDYRDKYPDPEVNLFYTGFSTYSISYCSGCPDFTVPIDEVPYHSRITDTQEWLPISMSFISRTGADSILLQLLVELEEVNILREPATGRRLYPFDG